MNFEDRLRQAFDEVAERLREDVQRELHAAIPALVRQIGEPSPVPEPLPDASSENVAASAVQRMVSAVREIDDASSLSEVLEAVLWAVAQNSARACLFLIRADNLVVWRSKGFGDAEDARLRTAPRTISLADGGVAAEAIRSRDVVATEAADRAPSGLAASATFGGAAARAIHVGGEVVAVLYAERTADKERDSLRDALAPTVELLSRHASRCLEAITAFRTAQLFTQPSDDGRRPARWGTPVETGDWAEDDADAARRYARLLISEIKLYHEPAVIAGRRDRNLASRLGGEIARARALYEQRVPRELDRRADYFDAEVVRTLANGDVSLLGVTN
jgi:hypothetical protein